jgi:hypothetical protein
MRLEYGNTTELARARSTGGGDLALLLLLFD